MATTYLQLTNELLRELNEVVLTSSTFSSAVGIQAHAKDCINRSYLDIVNEEPQWPFLATAESGATDPMYGNVSVETTADTRWYELKAASSALKDDYGSGMESYSEDESGDDELPVEKAARKEQKKKVNVR